MNEEQARRIVADMYTGDDPVDNGCPYCVADAVQALRREFPDLPWERIYEDVCDCGPLPAPFGASRSSS